MTTEARCRSICILNKINPDADAPQSFQTVHGFKRAPDGKVKQWMTWITTVESKRPQVTDKFEAEKKESKKLLQKIINETSQKASPKYSCYE